MVRSDQTDFLQEEALVGGFDPTGAACEVRQLATQDDTGGLRPGILLLRVDAFPHLYHTFVAAASHAGRGIPHIALAMARGMEKFKHSSRSACMYFSKAVFEAVWGWLSFGQAQSMHKLFDLLEDFVPAFLETVALPSDASDFGIFQELDGFHYGQRLALDLLVFPNGADSDKIQEHFPSIRHAALLYNAHLVYTNLALSDMRVLYSYLVSFNGAVSSHKLNRSGGDLRKYLEISMKGSPNRMISSWAFRGGHQAGGPCESSAARGVFQVSILAHGTVMAAEKATSGLDLDLQAVENVPRDTLVALLRRKDKEVKTQQGKLEKLEERYVKVVRFNKILMEDRQSFQRFCHELLPECDGAFEEAAAQEAPTDLNELLRQLAVWRRGAEAASEDRKVFQQFLTLVFPSDEVVADLLKRPSLGEEALDRLQQRWMQLEDLHNQSLASLNEMARQQVADKSSEIQACQKALRASEAQVQDLKAELTSMARDKAQMLKQKLHGKGSQNDSSFLVVEDPVDAGADAELQAVTEQKAAAECREKEAWQALERQRQAMQVGASFLNHVFTFGPIYSFGVFLPVIKADLNVSLTEVSAISSTMNTAQFMGSLVAGLLIPRRLGHATVAGICALCAFAGLAALSFVESIFLAYPAVILAGLGLGASNLAGLVALIDSVAAKKRATLVGLATCGTSVGTILLPQFYNTLTEVFDWRWAMRINALATFLALGLAAPLFRVPKTEASDVAAPQREAKGQQASNPCRDPRFVCWWLDMFVCFFGYFVPPALLADFAQNELQLPPEAAANAYTVIGICALLTRLCLGAISHICGGPRRVHMGCQILVGAVTCCLPFCWNLESLLVWSACYGLCIGPVIALISVVLSELFGTQALPLYHGVSRVGVGMGNLLGVPVAGLIAERWGYEFAIVLSGSLVMMATTFLVILAILHRRKLNAEAQNSSSRDGAKI
ncbi:Monocarboxylate transporter 2 [Symbiodinium microadriaticum]|uniref:Monocarboxylate transporter 2 n=1 Tax=Symbiodinium microadriaticum TaxID=2951 RepID=A0A1Q9F2R9_SYMMI|nr:Monocarboxylate transporter 2 [Symbiodinium microadriaticum]